MLTIPLPVERYPQIFEPLDVFTAPCSRSAYLWQGDACTHMEGSLSSKSETASGVSISMGAGFNVENPANTPMRAQGFEESEHLTCVDLAFRPG